MCAQPRWFFPRERGSLTLGELEGILPLFHRWLHESGIVPPANLAVISPNSLGWVIVRELALKYGYGFTPLSPRYLLKELLPMIECARPSLLFVEDSVGISEHPWIPVVPLSILDRFRKGTLPPPLPHPNSPLSFPLPEIPAGGYEILFTSGSSGSPRAVLRSRSSTDQRIADTIARFRFTAEERHILCAPLYHSGPLLFYGVFRSLGAEQWIYPRFDPEELLPLFDESFSPLALFFVPTMARRLALLAEKQGRRLQGVKHLIVAGGPMDRDTRSRLIRLLPEGTLWEFYGTTETGTIAVLPPDLQTKYGHTVGFPLPGVRILIVDEEGKLLPRGTIGRIAVLTPTMMVGYLTPSGELDPGRRMEGALLVGDLGERTEEGALILHGRADGVIVSGGVKIQAEEVESALKECPGVREAVVFGLEDWEWGERVVALVEPEERSSLHENELKESLRTKIAPFKIPKEIRFGTIPRTGTGKILRSREVLRGSWKSGSFEVIEGEIVSGS